LITQHTSHSQHWSERVWRFDQKKNYYYIANNFLPKFKAGFINVSGKYKNLKYNIAEEKNLIYYYKFLNAFFLNRRKY